MKCWRRLAPTRRQLAPTIRDNRSGGFGLRCLRLNSLWLLWVAGLCVPAVRAQQPSLAVELVRLGEQAASLDRSLPSFSCLQSAVSEELRPGKHGQPTQVVRHVEFTANLRVRRRADGKLNESAEFLTVDGQPLTASGFTMPAYAQGGFLQAISYFLPEQQHCYVYTQGAGRIDFAAAPHADEDTTCRSAGTTGFALLDEAGGIRHIERRVAAYGVNTYHIIPFAEVDLAPVTLNGAVYPLSRHLVSERANGRFTDRFESTYADCRLFAATVTIGPATVPAEGSSSDSAHPPP